MNQYNKDKHLTLLDDKIYGTCLNFKSTTERTSFCANGSSDTLIQKCNNNFCDFCCKSYVNRTEMGIK